MELGGGEERSQRSTSISWQDLVRSEGADVDSLRQLPLDLMLISRLCEYILDSSRLT